MATSCLSIHEQERRRKLFASPRTDQSTYLGRLQHFAALCRPWYIFATDKQLAQAQTLVESYCRGNAPASTTEDDVWEAKALCDSAVHPDTGEYMNVMGRMCFQPTGSSALSALLLTVGLKSTAMQLFLQWVNQSYMALLNYSNRNASRDGPELRNRSLQAYVCATAGSFVAAVGFGRLANRSTGLVAKKLVPMAAVAVSTCINVPIMRSSELSTGISVAIGETSFAEAPTAEATAASASAASASAAASSAAASSTAAAALKPEPTVLPTPSRVGAQIAVGSVCLSRVLNATADLIFPPLMVAAAQRRGYAWASSTRVLIPVYLVTCFSTIAISTPLTCAILPQRLGVPVSWLEPEVRREISRVDPDAKCAYINKGL